MTAPGREHERDRCDPGAHASGAHGDDAQGIRGGGVLVAFDADAGVGGVVHVGDVLARERRARLSVVGVARELPSGWVGVPGVGIIPSSLCTLADRAIAQAGRNCRDSVRGVGADVPVDHRVLCGPPDRVVDSLLATGEFAAVVVHGPWMSKRRMRRAARRWWDGAITVHAAWGPPVRRPGVVVAPASSIDVDR
jgi:hypothetical protein